MPASHPFDEPSLAKTTTLNCLRARAPMRGVLPFLLKRMQNIKPAYLAFCIQLLAFAVSICSLLSLQLLLGMTPSVLHLVALQGLLALALTIVLKMRTWWRYIQFIFPIALLVMSNLALPSSIYLIGFIFTLTWYWSTFRTQVPFYPSMPKVWRALSQSIPKDKPIHLIDIGSGIGDLAMYIAKAHPDSHISGIEIAPLPWLVSKFRAFVQSSSAQFILGNYDHLNFAHYDVVFAYLSPAAMPKLWQKASKEMLPGSMLISYEFMIPDTQPTQVLTLGKQGEALYIWRF